VGRSKEDGWRNLISISNLLRKEDAKTRPLKNLLYDVAEIVDVSVEKLGFSVLSWGIWDGQ
jgi:hypothetical protein